LEAVGTMSESADKVGRWVRGGLESGSGPGILSSPVSGDNGCESNVMEALQYDSRPPSPFSPGSEACEVFKDLLHRDSTGSGEGSKPAFGDGPLSPVTSEGYEPIREFLERCGGSSEDVGVEGGMHVKSPGKAFPGLDDGNFEIDVDPSVLAEPGYGSVQVACTSTASAPSKPRVGKGAPKENSGGGKWYKGQTIRTDRQKTIDAITSMVQSAEDKKVVEVFTQHDEEFTNPFGWELVRVVKDRREEFVALLEEVIKVCFNGKRTAFNCAINRLGLYKFRAEEEVSVGEEKDTKESDEGGDGKEKFRDTYFERIGGFSSKPRTGVKRSSKCNR